MANVSLPNFYPLPKDPKFINLTERKFGKFTVIGYAGAPSGSSHRRWFVQCECGLVKSLLRRALNQHIPCDQCDVVDLTYRGFVDGKYTAEYRTYSSAKARCTNSANKEWRYYGGRGIEFRFASFRDFIDALGLKPTPRHSLDRIDVDGHYEPGNVRWATWVEQNNNRRNNRAITLDGITKTPREWSSESGVNAEVIPLRIKKGMCVRCAIFHPLMPRGSRIIRCQELHRDVVIRPDKQFVFKRRGRRIKTGGIST